MNVASEKAPYRAQKAKIRDKVDRIIPLFHLGGEAQSALLGRKLR
jgi:hypothetical protein